MTGIHTTACSSPGLIGMVLAHPQRSAAYGALRLLVHITGPPPIFISGAVSKLHMDGDTQAMKTELRLSVCGGTELVRGGF
jgi:hypothetical protein